STPPPYPRSFPTRRSSDLGTMNVVSGITNSCNEFFNNIGYQLGMQTDGTYSSDYGLERLSKYAQMFGLNETSGLEIPEMDPKISDEDSVRSAMGQGTNNYTTSQLARYITRSEEHTSELQSRF